MKLYPIFMYYDASDSFEAPPHAAGTAVQAAPLRSWEPLEELRSDSYAGEPGVELLLQKGFHHFAGARAPEPAYRLMWRVDGVLKIRSPRHEELAEIDALFQAARTKGWE